MQIFHNEQNVRTLVDEQLKNLGWHLKTDKNCNVFQEQPRTTEEKKKLQGKRPDYVLYSSDSSRKEPIIIIETKKPGTNLDDALRQGDEYAEELGAPIVFATDGIYYKTFHTAKQKPLFLNGEEVDELIRELEAIKFLENNEVNTISKEVVYDRKQLIKIFEESNDLLRDEGFRAGIERFGEFSNILFLKLIGELEDLKEEEDRIDEVILDKYLRWSQWKNKKGGELLDFVNDTVLTKIGIAYKDDDIFTPLRIKNPNTLKKIIDKLDPLKLINIDSDIKGDAFEYFLKQSTATKNDLGEYFTPRHIVKVMVKLLNPQIGETIYDPFCGTGGTLIEAFKHISHNMARTKANWKRLREETLFGNEITTTARITKMNMILVGDGHSGIQQKNSLKNPVENKYDIVVTNMPYSQKTEYGSYYDLPSTNGDSICVQHCIKAIDKASENGRMALVIPEGFLFRKDLQKTREYLLDRCILKSVISLPQGVFLPYTGVKTNILYCTDIKKKKKQDKFWYFDVKNDGYSLDSHRRKLEGKTDLQKFLEYRNPETQNSKDILKVGFSQINMEDVRKNDLVLVGSLYKIRFDYGNIQWEIVELGNEDYFEILSGGTPDSKKKEYWDGKINWATLVDLPADNFITELSNTERKITEAGLKNSSAKLIPKNSVLVSSRATIGRIAVTNKETATNQGFKNIVIKDKEKVNTKFLAYMMARLKDEMEKLASGGTFKEISKQNFSKLKVPLPPIEVQEEIVKELDSYQKVIAGAKQIIDNYKPNIDIKDEWRYEALVKVSDIKMGQSPDGKFYNSKKEGLPFYQGKTEFGDIYLKPPKKWTTQISKEANKNDILMSVRAPVGPVNLSTEKICIGRGLSAIKPFKQLNYLFLFYYLQNIQDQIEQLSTGSTFSAIKKSDIEKIKIPIPTIEEQENIISQIENEMKIVAYSKEAIAIFKKKIQNKLDFIWGK